MLRIRELGWLRLTESPKVDLGQQLRLPEHNPGAINIKANGPVGTDCSLRRPNVEAFKRKMAMYEELAARGGGPGGTPTETGGIHGPRKLLREKPGPHKPCLGRLGEGV
ncbi:hypothetical protein XENOCAPTIV_026799 [Xenoophorus captivus]|uniref:Uncharacterized protein n=1 Tax=Xenoophorus captivus TaxID=1517983 RepID=A0ABV0Q6E6_9TELE